VQRDLEREGDEYRVRVNNGGKKSEKNEEEKQKQTEFEERNRGLSHH